ncbi:toll/interleukin-1 receptor domain-containing protein [Rubrivivax rivuli]|nr:toll/interleukin-1 receptor domain-containing protein [Rubrivivax rivuli]
MAGIFISYRRDDDRYAAGRLADDLAGVFGPENLFRDIESIAPGQDFEVALNTALTSCAVMLVVIGPRWLGITDAQGRRRLEQDGDWVRTEVATALQRGIPVIPVLLQGTVLPLPEQLPADLQALPKRRFLELADTRWPRDVEEIVHALLKVPGLQRAAAPTPPPPTPAKPAPKKKAVPAREASAGAAAKTSPTAAAPTAPPHGGKRWGGALTVLGGVTVLVALNWSALRELFAPEPQKPAPVLVLGTPVPAPPAASAASSPAGARTVPLGVVLGKPVAVPATLAASGLSGRWAWRKSNAETLTVVLRQQGGRIEGDLLQDGQVAGRVTGTHAGSVATVEVQRHLALNLQAKAQCTLSFDPQAAALAGPCNWGSRQEDTRWTRAAR